MTTPGSRRWTAPLIIICLAAPVSACVPGNRHAAASTPPGSAAPGQPASSGGHDATTQPGSTSHASRDQGSEPSPGAGGTRCRAAQLRVTAERGGGSAGHPAILLIFTNTGTQTCTMYGFPGASFLTAENGQEINQPAQRSAAITPTTVVLAPGTAAQAALRWSNPDLYDQATCHPATAAGVRVYPPDDTTAVFVTTEQQLCSASGTGRPEILPVQAR